LTTRRQRSLFVPAAAVILAVLVPYAILLGTAWLFGWRFQPVETGSMAPAVPEGALAVVQPADPTRIGPGAIVTFADPFDPSRLVAHRIVRQLPGNPPHWQTKGDANREADPIPIQASAVQGVVAWSIPGLGSLVGVLRGAPAVVLLVGLPLGLLLVTEVRDRRQRPVRAGPSDAESSMEGALPGE
jgi:signal peptidase